MDNLEVQRIVDENGYQFFNCYRCGELISAIQLVYALNTTGVGCRCGCMKVQPVQIKPEQYPLKNVVEMGMFLLVDESAYIDDFRHEIQPLCWDPDQIEEAVVTIRQHFAAARATCN